MDILQFIFDNLIPIIIIGFFMYYLPKAIRYYKRWKKELDDARSGGKEAIDGVLIRATGDMLQGTALSK